MRPSEKADAKEHDRDYDCMHMTEAAAVGQPGISIGDMLMERDTGSGLCSRPE